MQGQRTRNNNALLKYSLCWITLICLTAFPHSLLAGADPSRSFFIPQIGHGIDQAGNRFSTEINLINLSTTASQVVISSFDDNGDPLRLLEQDFPSTAPESVSELTVQIPGTGTARVRSLNENPDTALDTGWAQVTTQNAVGVQVVFRIRDAAGTLVTAADVRIGPIVTAASMFGIQNANLGTAIALLNPPGNPSARVTVEAIGSDGNGIVSSFVDLQPGEKTARFLFQFLPSLGDFNGSIEIRSRNMADPDSEDRPPVSILPLVQEGVVLTTQNLFPPRQRP